MLTSSPNSVVIIGLGFGLFGYDNAFVSPLAALPLFVEKYQGLNSLGLPIFTVGEVLPSKSIFS